MKLNDWMKENRASFDTEEAPEGLWKPIQDAVPKAERSKPKVWLWTAAAAVLLIGFSWWMQPSAPSELRLNEDEKLPDSFLAQEQNYQQDLQLIEANINFDALADDPEYTWVFEELKELESINKQYRSDLDAFAPKDELLSVLIDCYEKRLRLLQRLQMEIERNQKHTENENINL